MLSCRREQATLAGRRGSRGGRLGSEPAFNFEWALVLTVLGTLSVIGSFPPRGFPPTFWTTLFDHMAVSAPSLCARGYVLCSCSLCVLLRYFLLATSSCTFCAQMQAFPKGHTMRCTRTLSPALLCQNCRTHKQVTRENKRKETTSKEQHPAHQEFCLSDVIFSVSVSWPHMHLAYT